MPKTTREKEFEDSYDLAWATWGTFQLWAMRDLRAVTRNAWTEDDYRKFKKLGIEPLSFPMIRRIIKPMTGYERRNGLSIKFEPVGLEDEETTTQLNAIATQEMATCHGYRVISDAFEFALVTGINLVNVYQTRNWDIKLRRYPYNSFLLDPNFQDLSLSDCNFGIIRQKLTPVEAIRLLPGRESEINSIARHNQEGARDGKFPNMMTTHVFGAKLLNYDEWQQRVTKKKKFFVKDGDWFTDESGRRMEWKGTNEDLKALIQANPFLDTMDDWVESIDVTIFLEGEEIAHAVDPWGIGDFSYTPTVGFWVPEESDIRYKIQGVVRSLLDPQRAHDKERNYALSMMFQQIGAGMDVIEGVLKDPDDMYATGNKPRMFKKGSDLNRDMKDRQPPQIPKSLTEHTKELTNLMPLIANMSGEVFGTVDGKAQIAGFLGQMRLNQAMTALGDLYDNHQYAQDNIGTKILKLIQQKPANIVRRMLNQEPSKQFRNKSFGRYDSVSSPGLRTDTQRNLFYQELLALKKLGAETNDPVPFGWKFILRNSPISMRGEVMKEIERQEQETKQAQQAQQAQAKAIQDLAIEQAKATIESERTQSMERIAQAEENRTGAALDRAKTTAQIQEIGQKPFTEAMKLAFKLESDRIKADASTNV